MLRERTRKYAPAETSNGLRPVNPFLRRLTSKNPSDSEQRLIHSTCRFYSSPAPSSPPPPEPLRLTNCGGREKEMHRCKVRGGFKRILTARFRRRLCPGRCSARGPCSCSRCFTICKRCHFLLVSARHVLELYLLTSECTRISTVGKYSRNRDVNL